MCLLFLTAMASEPSSLHHRRLYSSCVNNLNCQEGIRQGSKMKLFPENPFSVLQIFEYVKLHIVVMLQWVFCLLENIEKHWYIWWLYISEQLNLLNSCPDQSQLWRWYWTESLLAPQIAFALRWSKDLIFCTNIMPFHNLRYGTQWFHELPSPVCHAAKFISVFSIGCFSIYNQEASNVSLETYQVITNEIVIET